MAIGIGVNAWVWTAPVTTDSMHLMKKAAKMGFDYFEIPVEDPANLDANKVKAAIDESGIKAIVCGAFGPTRDLTHEDPKYRQESLDYIRATVKLAEKWGSKVIAGPAYSAVGKRRQVSPEQKKIEWDLAVKGLREAGKMAADHGVTLALEPLNRFETDLINTCAQCLKLVKEVDSKGVGIHLDTFHMHIEETCVSSAVKLAGKRLVHCHACENDRGAPGTGQVHWKEWAKALKEIKYDGAVVIESFTPECKSIAAAAAIWRPLAKTQDSLARDGLKFLKKLLK
ncbi:MAG: sugar phosphate isomerase/epimerase [Planctomycetota bacterium]|nr:sugar phosphate isomerase/epimerase [Planctomycetota bacterium]